MYMNRRRFIRLSTLTTAGLPFLQVRDLMAVPINETGMHSFSPEELYRRFKEPDARYHPFVRWWWNGDRLDAKELLRELDVMKAAGIGGVEINPIRFPDNTDDLGIRSLEWLSDEWIAMLKVTLEGAKERGITCDMIVGSGWPFGGEFLSREDQSQMVALETRNLTGGKVYQFSRRELLDAVDPGFHSKYEDKLKELLMIKLVPLQLDNLDDCIDLGEQLAEETIRVEVPEGTYVLYYLVKMTGFMAVINGAPGAGGPVLNHYRKSSVEQYLYRMSDKLKAHIGPLGNYFRSFFTDSLELEGANWCEDMFAQFEERKGYDLAPYFPFILFKVGAMGNASDEIYGAKLTDALRQRIDRVRYDFEDVRVALFKERFTDTFADWCRENGVQSRMQAYGRECNPVEGSMAIDIPECETWLGSGEGNEFSDADYRRGRAYSMINKFVSSGAHLAGKQVISCEEMTNTNMAFNATLDQIKVAGDQSILSGVTHSVLHGFNYSPLEAPFPGWIRYGTFFNERNTWWPYFKQWADYKARIYALLQHAEMQADIAILPPLADLSMRFGFQRDPFPSFAYPKYLFQVWEAVHQNGNGCDYITENCMQQAKIENGHLTFGTRRYKALLLVDVDSLLPETVKAIKAFTAAGGKLICIEKAPHQSPSLQEAKQESVTVDILKGLDSRQGGIYPAPQEDLVNWYKTMQQRFGLMPYVEMDSTSKWVSQVYYKLGDLDIFFFSNYHVRDAHRMQAKFAVTGKKAWLWNPETGERMLYPDAGEAHSLQLNLEPSSSVLLVFDQADKGETYVMRNFNQERAKALDTPWKVTLHPYKGDVRTTVLDKLVDFSQRPDLQAFGGTIIYENTFQSTDADKVELLYLGETHGVVEARVNGKLVGTQWYGKPLFNIAAFVKAGANTVQVKCITTLGNYMKSLKTNKVAQQWVQGQPLFPVGLIGPVQVSTAV